METRIFTRVELAALYP